MATINRAPLGFLSWLDSKSLGDTPSDYTPTVSPTIDMNEFYTASTPVISAAQSNAVTTANVDTTVVNVQVPQTEAWLVESVDGAFVAAAINTIGRVQLRVLTNGILYRLPQLHDPFPGLGLIVGVGFTGVCPWRNFILPPGAVIQGFLSVVSGNGTASINCAYRRLVV